MSVDEAGRGWQRWAAAALLAGLTAALIGWGYAGGEAASPDALAQRPLLPSPLLAAGEHADSAAAPGLLARLGPQGGMARSPAEVEQRIFGEGSLRGAALDGDWGRFDHARGTLTPDIGLRRRFDQLLSTLGEVNIDELSSWLQARLQQELPPAQAQAVAELWQRYLRLQDWRFQTAISGGPGDDAERLRAALAERQQVRRQLLGADWAAAFYADDEAALAAAIARIGQQPAGSAAAEAAPPPTTTAHSALLAAAPPAAHQGATAAAELHRARSAAFGAEAAERLAAEDAYQARWEQRLAAARAHWATLQAAAELSPTQRQAALARYLDEHFTDAREQLRVRALLGV